MLLEIIPGFQFTDLTSVASEVLHNAIERVTQSCKLAVVITDQQWADLVVRGTGIDIGCSSHDPLIVNKYHICFGSLDVRRWAGYTFLIDNRLFEDIHRAADNLICAEWVARNCRPSDADRLFKEVATYAASASVVTPDRPVYNPESNGNSFSEWYKVEDVKIDLTGREG